MKSFPRRHDDERDDGLGIYALCVIRGLDFWHVEVMLLRLLELQLIELDNEAVAEVEFAG